jgi:hypothetical protein
MDAACMKRLKALNEWLALRLSAGFSTMTCFWVFNMLALSPLMYPASLPIMQFISSGYLQLVALPLLAVSGIILSRDGEIRAKQDHIAIMAEVEMLKSLQAEQHEILKLLKCSLEIKA